MKISQEFRRALESEVRRLIEMQVQVRGPGGRTQQVTIKASRLTPQSAISAVDIALGVGANATVTDGRTAYRVTGVGPRRRAKRVRLDPADLEY